MYWVLLTLGTPHHGSVAAVPDWGLLTIDKKHVFNTACFSNITYNFSDTISPCLLIPSEVLVSFNVNRPGSYDLAWDNFDGEENGIPNESFHLELGQIDLGDDHVLSKWDANIPLPPTPRQPEDDDLHPSSLRANGTLSDLNTKEKYLKKLITYGGYFRSPDPKITWDEFYQGLLKNQPHLLLKYSNGLIASFSSKEQESKKIGHFAANDGLVPLQSALFLLKDSSSEPMYEVLDPSWKPLRLSSQIKIPLEIKNLKSRSQVRKYRTLEDYDHLDLLEGKPEKQIFEYIKDDLLDPFPTITSSLKITQPPAPPYHIGDTISAEFTITNKGGTPITFDVLTVGGRDPDNQVADFTWENNITLEAGESYSYQGTLTLSKTGTYHFFTAYKTPDGQWNTAIPTEEGIINTLDIIVKNTSSSGFLSFVEGDPGIPGDGVFINTGAHFHLDNPIPLNQFTNGFTTTIFSLPQYIQNFIDLQLNVIKIVDNVRFRKCSAGYASSFITIGGNTTFNNNVGVFVNIPQISILDIADYLNKSPDCDSVTIDNLFIDGFVLFYNQYTSPFSIGLITTLDAATILPGQNNIPREQPFPGPGEF